MTEYKGDGFDHEMNNISDGEDLAEPRSGRHNTKPTNHTKKKPHSHIEVNPPVIVKYGRGGGTKKLVDVGPFSGR